MDTNALPLVHKEPVVWERCLAALVKHSAASSVPEDITKRDSLLRVITDLSALCFSPTELAKSNQTDQIVVRAVDYATFLHYLHIHHVDDGEVAHLQAGLFNGERVKPKTIVQEMSLALYNAAAVLYNVTLANLADARTKPTPKSPVVKQANQLLSQALGLLEKALPSDEESAGGAVPWEFVKEAETRVRFALAVMKYEFALSCGLKTPEQTLAKFAMTASHEAGKLPTGTLAVSWHNAAAILSALGYYHQAKAVYNSNDDTEHVIREAMSYASAAQDLLVEGRAISPSCILETLMISSSHLITDDIEETAKNYLRENNVLFHKRLVEKHKLREPDCFDEERLLTGGGDKKYTVPSPRYPKDPFAGLLPTNDEFRKVEGDVRQLKTRLGTARAELEEQTEEAAATLRAAKESRPQLPPAATAALERLLFVAADEVERLGITADASHCPNAGLIPLILDPTLATVGSAIAELNDCCAAIVSSTTVGSVPCITHDELRGRHGLSALEASYQQFTAKRLALLPRLAVLGTEEAAVFSLDTRWDIALRAVIRQGDLDALLKKIAASEKAVTVRLQSAVAALQASEGIEVGSGTLNSGATTVDALRDRRVDLKDCVSALNLDVPKLRQYSVSNLLQKEAGRVVSEVYKPALELLELGRSLCKDCDTVRSALELEREIYKKFATVCDEIPRGLRGDVTPTPSPEAVSPDRAATRHKLKGKKAGAEKPPTPKKGRGKKTTRAETEEEEEETAPPPPPPATSRVRRLGGLVDPALVAWHEAEAAKAGDPRPIKKTRR